MFRKLLPSCPYIALLEQTHGEAIFFLLGSKQKEDANHHHQKSKQPSLKCQPEGFSATLYRYYFHLLR